MSIPNYPVAPHFTYKELACRCCGSYTADPRLLLCLEWLRHEISLMRNADTPIIITSGYRCPQHNAAVGGSKSSLHMLGLAADFVKPAGIDWRPLYDRLSSLPLVGGLGLYPRRNFIHVDVRTKNPNGSSVTWSVLQNGFEPVEAAWS